MAQVFNPFRSALTENDLFGAATVTLDTAKYIEIGRYTVLAGSALALGYGGERGQAQAEGRIYMDINRAGPADVDGMIRFELRDPQDRSIATLFEARTEQLRTSASDRTQQLPFPIRYPGCGEDWSIVLYMKGDTADTITKADSVIFADVTHYTAR